MAIRPCNPEAHPLPCDEAADHAHRALSLVLQHMLSTQLCFLYQPGDFLDDAAAVAEAFSMPPLAELGQASWGQTGLRAR